MNQIFKTKKQYLQINELQYHLMETLIIPDDIPFNHNHLQSNSVSTTITTPITFLPIALLRQFSQPSNIYFLIIGILQIIPFMSYTNGIPIVYIPLSIVMLIGIIKDALEEYNRYKQDSFENMQNILKYHKTQQSFYSSYWKHIHPGDILLISQHSIIPCDILILGSSSNQGIVYVETKTIDGETNLKLKKSLHALSNFKNDPKLYDKQNIKFTYDRPNPIMYKFNGHYQISEKDTLYSLTYSNFIERGCILSNTKWIIGLSLYVGMNCKIMLNGIKPHQKISKLDHQMKISIVAIAFFLLILCLFSSIYAHIWSLYHPLWYLIPQKNSDFISILINLGLWFSLLSYFIPISLLINTEIVKYLQAIFLEKDQNFGGKAKVNCSNLVEQLGQIDFIFSDKTGTLTKNQMSLQQMRSVPNVSGFDLLQQYDLAMICICLCHQTIALNSKFIGPSPDEITLLNHCQDNGYIYEGLDNNDIIKLNIRGSILEFKKIEMQEFTSENKFMSITVQFQDTKYLFIKGADEVIQISQTEFNYLQMLKQYSQQGLRTLVLAGKNLENKDLELLGITGVEDELQDNVSSTISSFMEAGIKLWVLTGDKVETAINIGYSCKLLSQNYQIHIIDAYTIATIEENFLSLDQDNYAIIVTGRSLELIMKTKQLQSFFFQKALNAKSVLVCRVSPKQKQEVVQSIKKVLPKAITLAIGDGANDVPMIMEAHVGVGIQGVEGSQATRSSDFSLPEFQHLRRLLFYYGRECSRKNSILVLYIFYKNQVFISPYFWFGIFNAFSGQYLYDQLLQQMFNLVFTSLPQVLYCLFDEEYPSSEYLQVSKSQPNELERLPKLYMKRQNYFNYKWFIMWVMIGMIQGLIILVCCIFMLDNHSSEYSQGRQFSMFETGMVAYGGTILICNLKILTFTHTNYIITILIVFIEVGLYLIGTLLINVHVQSELFKFVQQLYSNINVYLCYLVIMGSTVLIDLAIERVNYFSDF